MKNKILIVCVLSLFLVLFDGTVSEVSFAVGQQIIIEIPEETLTTEEIEAQAVLVSFFNALVEYNTKKIETLLGGKLLEKRKGLLNNPDYSEFLMAKYSNAGFEILRIKGNKKNKIEIDAKIILNDQESMQERYFLEKTTDPTDLIPKYRIYKIIEQNK